MERLIHSSSSLLSKPFLKPAHSPTASPETTPFHSGFPFLSVLISFNLARFLCSREFNLFFFFFFLSPPQISCSLLEEGAVVSSSPDPDVSSTPGSHFLKRIVGAASNQQKVCCVLPSYRVRFSRRIEVITAGAVLLVSALFVLLVHPIITSSAYATGFSAASAVNGKIVRTELLSSAWTGFFAGCLHTLSGPDHLAALAPLSIGRTRDRLHIEILRTWGTRVVGFTLLVIGAMGIREASESPAPCVVLENGECDVSMYDSLEAPVLERRKLALALPSRIAGAAFLGMFLIGTVVAMGSYTVFIGSCSQALKERVPRVTEKLTWASSLVAIALGLAIIFSQFFGFSLY
ncbi:hypothetical protein CK203_087851 [Vitis vinifera]|uniref:Urease accessory protein UreH-like transmembrane domain-containing protein n=1 Tax=Vitis vinifera TaxID=29760 RepID=A0A438E430_VITVI|nr:hypothetical protein CK203_087851 [Vitis vinifera]